MEKTVKHIIDTKKRLLSDLNCNIFSNFNNEEELLLHSKHGYIRIKDKGKVVAEGIVGAFKVDLPLIVDDEDYTHLTRFPIIKRINWNESIFVDEDEDQYYFEFRPIKLSELC